MKIFAFSRLSLLFLILSACQAGYVIEESNLSVKDHRKAVVAAIGEARTVSENGREISSYFHDKKLKPILDMTKVKVRFYTKVLILGERRPFEVHVEVHVEQRDPDTRIFQDVGLDDRLTRIQALAIKETLNQSLEKAHLLDGEKPF